MEVTTPTITRLARKAGVKSVAEDCYSHIRALLYQELTKVVEASVIVNSAHQTKTLMPDDVYQALVFLDKNLTQSHDLGTTTVGIGGTSKK